MFSQGFIEGQLAHVGGRSVVSQRDMTALGVGGGIYFHPPTP
jgi:hypothetical protein